MKMDHRLGHESSLNKFEGMQIVQSIFLHNGINIEINNIKIPGKSNIWKLNNIILNYMWIKDEIKR